MKKMISCLLMIAILTGLCSFSVSANNIDSKTCNHDTVIVLKEKSATYFKKGYTGDKVCETCGVTIKNGKNIPKLKLKKPKINVSIDGKKLYVKYYKVKNATGFQIKCYVIKDYKIKGNTVTKIKGKTVTKSYNTKKNVTKTIKRSTGSIYKVCVRTFIKKNGKKAYSKWKTVELAEADTLNKTTAPSTQSTTKAEKINDYPGTVGYVANKNLSLHIIDMNLDRKVPVIKVQWNNKTGKPIEYGNAFYIYRKTDNGLVDCDLMDMRAVTSVAHVTFEEKPTLKFALHKYDLSKKGTYILRFSFDSGEFGKANTKSYTANLEFKVP